MANNKITIGYWELRGFGQPIRNLAQYLGIQLNEKRYASTMEGFNTWQSEKFKLGLDFPNLPYMLDGDVKLTESRAIVKYLAGKYGKALYPSSITDKATCDMLENVIFDIWLGGLRYFFNGDEVESLKNNFLNEVPKKLQYLETFLKNKKFVLGDQITYVDFFLYEMTYHFTKYQADYLNNYKNLMQFKIQFEKIPAIANYMESNDYIAAPCINPNGKITF